MAFGHRAAHAHVPHTPPHAMVGGLKTLRLFKRNTDD
ncbi:hypothetical protein F383_04214 [Gossypium arboreum]|uniref:Uncharacterized protein n=1 Tax=Gossypium arboreum TaxID=29729 RepID=A0A0B0PPV4_GOSAR|nr:hypothetical protein F383_04214 [Gossypium arboreum]